MRILITAGPTREYLDDVRFLSNASTGRMGYAISEAAIQAGHQVVLVSGPVSLVSPEGCHVRNVVTTGEMQAACLEEFPRCDGAIGAAAVCDYRPVSRTSGKIKKTGRPLSMELVETSDILAMLGQQKGSRWIVGFALEAENARIRALAKLASKNCDAIVLNRPAAIGSDDNDVELIVAGGQTAAIWAASKTEIARRLISWIDEYFKSRPERGQA